MSGEMFTTLHDEATALRADLRDGVLVPTNVRIGQWCADNIDAIVQAFKDWPLQTASVAAGGQPAATAPAEGGGDSDSATPLTKGDGETWEAYAHRLERRIKEQRDHIKALNVLYADNGNRADRKKINRLKRALVAVTENWQREREARIALVRTVGELKARSEA